MTRLTDSQLVVLSAAASREDGSILPLPSKLKGGAVTKVVDSLIRRGLAERIESDRPAVPDLIRITGPGLEVIGAEPEEDAPAEAPPAKPKRKAGKQRAASGARTEKPARTSRRTRKAAPAKRARRGDRGADGATKTRKARADSKQAQALAMLRRPKGASGGELEAAFGWQPHTVRGFIAGAVKKKLDLDVTSEKVEGRGRVYRIAG